jgi:hypothetical protein
MPSSFHAKPAHVGTNCDHSRFPIVYDPSQPFSTIGKPAICPERILSGDGG